jgi:hypothetical protein
MMPEARFQKYYFTFVSCKSDWFSRFSQEQNIVVLNEHRAELSAADFFRKHGLRMLPLSRPRRGNARQNQHLDIARAGAQQRTRTSIGRGRGGHDIIDQQN